MSAELLAGRFGIGLERARHNLKATTQRGTRSALLPISRRYRADRQFGVRRLNGKFATDTARYDDSLEDIPTRQTYTSTERNVKMSAEVLSDWFGIGL